ncbi:hypothetical protein TNCV_368161 [Trichonephila clavipes]|nr:hypothetical protein TNCV_368161 [Trichonephila clavipes]
MGSSSNSLDSRDDLQIEPGTHDVEFLTTPRNASHGASPTMIRRPALSVEKRKMSLQCYEKKSVMHVSSRQSDFCLVCQGVDE